MSAGTRGRRLRSPSWAIAALPMAAAIGLALTLATTVPLEGHTRITTDVTWSEDVRPILRRHCMRCHRPGGVAPSYADFTFYGTDSEPGARAWATAIEEELLTGRMPPWDADRRYGDFANDRTLTQEETDTIIAWVQGGAPQGPRRDLPPPPEFAAGAWELGPPEIDLRLAETLVLPADDESATVAATLPIVVDEATWITAFEFRSEVAGQVARMMAWIVDPEDAEPESLELEVQVPYDPFRDEDEPEPTRMRQMPAGERFLGQWLPGDPPVLLPAGAGKRLRPGSALRLVVEYSRRQDSVGDLLDRPGVGLHLAVTDDEVDLITEATELEPAPRPRRRDRRRAARRGGDGLVTAAATRLAEDVRLIALWPRLPAGTERAEVTASYPDGRSVVLLLATDLDPRLRSSYLLAEPLRAPAGTELGLRIAPASAAPDAELLVDHTLDDHLVLPEVYYRPAAATGSSGGMLIGNVFGAGGERPEGGGAPDAPTPAVDPADPNAAAHMDHSPLHGGQFFMAPNQYHHVEGALPAPGVFRAYVYDDFKRPLDPRNFAGRVVFERYDEASGDFAEEEYPLEPAVGTDYLEARISDEMPAEFFAGLWLAGEQQRFDFYFEEPTKDEAPTSRSYALAAGDHSHVRPPLTIPEEPLAIVVQLEQRLAELDQKMARGDWLRLYVPAFDARDLAEALLERLDGVRARDRGRIRKAVSRIMQSAAELDRAGDLADPARARRARDKLSENLRVLQDALTAQR